MKKMRKLTEKVLLDNFVKIVQGSALTREDCFVSMIDGEAFLWTYYNDRAFWPDTLDRKEAKEINGIRAHQNETFRIPLQVRIAKHPKLTEINSITKAIFDYQRKEYLLSRCNATPVKNPVKFIYYSGENPNLCEGELILCINGKYAFFGSKSLSSGGNTHIDENSNEVITKGRWKVKIPKEYSMYTRQIHKVVNDNVPKGCCGGCI